jgi:hypothetical protein
VNEHSAMLNPAATDHLPFFITAPGQSDGLFNAMLVFIIAFVFGIGLLYLRLHALPEHMAHGTSKVQMQIVGVLALLALFTGEALFRLFETLPRQGPGSPSRAPGERAARASPHNHIFWIAALLIALVQFPNFSAPLASMAQSLERMAGGPPQGALVSSPGVEVAPQQAAPTQAVPARTAPLAETEPAPAVPERVA